VSEKVKIVVSPGLDMPKVIDPATGQNIPYCYGFDIHSRVDEITSATIYCYPTVEFEGQAKVVLSCPNCHSQVSQKSQSLWSRFRSFLKL
jgi:hypothetical protein